MIAQVSIDSEGAVTVVCDSDEALDEEEQRLQGLRLDDMVDRAARTAIETWFALRGDTSDEASDEHADR